jgi:hypothetical protein
MDLDRVSEYNSPGSHAPAWESVFQVLHRVSCRRRILKGVPTQEHGNEKG